MVTLQEPEAPYRAVPIVIGQPEARAIQAAWTGQVQRRPSTWDLFVSAIGLLDARLDDARRHPIQPAAAKPAERPACLPPSLRT